MCLRNLMIAPAFVLAFSGISVTASAQDRPRENTDRPGNDFRNVALRGNSGDCLELCRRTRGCRAWTFVKPGFQGASARCWLKDVVPAAVPNSCCTSGVIRIMHYLPTAGRSVA
jgi:PAN domain-containing protein